MCSGAAAVCCSAKLSVICYNYQIDMQEQLEQTIAETGKNVFGEEITVELTRPDESFGDYSTNIAMQLAGKLGKAPREIAEELSGALRADLAEVVSEVTVAGPGFINIRLTDGAIVSMLDYDVSAVNRGRKVLLEYSCPNAFKQLHTGHLYQTIAGDSIGRLLEATGVEVFRANFGGDVGLHVAKSLYGIITALGEAGHYDQLNDVEPARRTQYLSTAYVAGAKAYEEDEDAKQAIATINGQVYGFHANNDHESDLARIYWQCREWSYEYFKSFYESIAVEPFDKYYPESETMEPGIAMVRANTPGVFEESDGAIVFRGEKVGLFTNVFITSKGLPAYGAKDLGVVKLEAGDFDYDQRVLMTGVSDTAYVKVVFAALQSINPELAAKQVHHPNGTVKFGSGQKMSSRLGNVTSAVDVLKVVGDAVEAADDQSKQNITLGAIKYSFLKQRLGGDIAFDLNESVRLEGNSGPYLQYAHARACSILRKSENPVETSLQDTILEAGERTMVRALGEYSLTITKSVKDLMPHHLCTYLYELSQTFNRFYENNRVMGDEREGLRLTLVKRYADTLAEGLQLLGIVAPEQM
ncbi:MAG: argS [Candidatus Saccharibacteria bacterium]|nr:argS [Candidatus Saccharibacteria bacterium]